MANFKSTIPERIKERNLSVNRFSQEVGINRNTATKLANGEIPGKNVDYIFKQLCDFFGCDLCDLFMLDD